MKPLVLAVIIAAAACGREDHGTSKFSRSGFPVHSALELPSHPLSQYGPSKKFYLYQEQYSCHDIPSCDYRGELVEIIHRAPGGAILEADAGSYQLVPHASPADAGVELREALVWSAYVTPRNGRPIEPRSGESQIGCTDYSSPERSGNVEVSIDGGVFSVHLDTTVWEGTFIAEACTF